MWQFKISTGEISEDGTFTGSAYSGKPGEYRNNPDFCAVHDRGPIPVGVWDIGSPFNHPTKGPLVLPLTPDASTETFGRSGFLIHGDSIEHPGDASEGCIITARTIRQLIAQSGDNQLTVIP